MVGVVIAKLDVAVADVLPVRCRCHHLVAGYLVEFVVSGWS